MILHQKFIDTLMFWFPASFGTLLLLCIHVVNVCYTTVGGVAVRWCAVLRGVEGVMVVQSWCLQKIAWCSRRMDVLSSGGAGILRSTVPWLAGQSRSFYITLYVIGGGYPGGTSLRNASIPTANQQPLAILCIFYFGLDLKVYSFWRQFLGFEYGFARG